jgi:hypothetical protein
MEEDLAMGLSEERRGSRAGAVLPEHRAELDVEGRSVVAQVGTPASDDYRRAGAISVAFPVALREAAQRQSDAVALVLSLLLDHDAEIRMRQLAEVAQRHDPATARLALAHFESAQGLHPMLRLPLAAMLFPQLRRRPRSELQKVMQTSEVMIHADGHVGLFEYCLARLLQRQVIEALDPSSYRAVGKRKLARCRDALTDLFGVLARSGHDDEASARRAYSAGLQCVLPGAGFSYQPPEEWVTALDRALPLLDSVDSTGKQLLVEGLVAAISHDGHVAVAEAELLRVVCASLHCPLPPMLETVAP